MSSSNSNSTSKTSAPSMASDTTSTYSYEKPAEQKSRTSTTQKIKNVLSSLGHPPTAEYDRQRALETGEPQKDTKKAFESPAYAQNLPRH